MVNTIVFPSSFFDTRRVDEDLQQEYDAVVETGLFDVIIFGYEKWFDEGKLVLANAPSEEVMAVYRGWMMKPEQYETFYTIRREKQVYTHHSRRLQAQPLSGRIRRSGPLSRIQPRQPDILRKSIYTRRQLCQRAVPEAGNKGRRPVGQPHQQYKPAGQHGAHTLKGYSSDGRLDTKTTTAGRGCIEMRCHQHIRSAVMVPDGDKRGDETERRRVYPSGMAQPRGILPRRHILQALPAAV